MTVAGGGRGGGRGREGVLLNGFIMRFNLTWEETGRGGEGGRQVGREGGRETVRREGKGRRRERRETRSSWMNIRKKRSKRDILSSYVKEFFPLLLCAPRKKVKAYPSVPQVILGLSIIRANPSLTSSPLKPLCLPGPSSPCRSRPSATHQRASSFSCHYSVLSFAA